MDAKFYTRLGRRLIEGGKNKDIVTFVGDSITSPDWCWFCPMVSKFNGLNVVNKGIVSDTTYRVIDRLSDIKATNADMYVLAVGINDIRHYMQGVAGSETYCAKSVEEYLGNMATIVNYLKPADIHVISIFPSFPGDPRGNPVIFNEKIDEWNTALKVFCDEGNIGYSDITVLLRDYISTQTKINKYVPDGVHPSDAGARLYSHVALWERTF